METYDKKGKLVTYTADEGEEDFNELEEEMLEDEEGLDDTDDVMEEEEVKQE